MRTVQKIQTLAGDQVSFFPQILGPRKDRVFARVFYPFTFSRFCNFVIRIARKCVLQFQGKFRLFSAQPKMGVESGSFEGVCSKCEYWRVCVCVYGCIWCVCIPCLHLSKTKRRERWVKNLPLKIEAILHQKDPKGNRFQVWASS